VPSSSQREDNEAVFTSWLNVHFVDKFLNLINSLANAKNTVLKLVDARENTLMASTDYALVVIAENSSGQRQRIEISIARVNVHLPI